MENNFTDELIKSYAGAICGIDTENGTFSPTVLIKNVNLNHGRLKIYGDDLEAFELVMGRMIGIDKNGYDDGYSKNIDINTITKLNGIGFENFLETFSHGHMQRMSQPIFSIDKAYEEGTDFIILPYEIKSDSALVQARPLEAKNCINMNSFLQTRKHNTLYAFVNSREEGKMRLLCKLKQEDRLNPEGLEIYGDFKVIEPWFWMKDLFENYQKNKLDYSWAINRGHDDIGDYIEFVSPRQSNKKTIS